MSSPGTGKEYVSKDRKMKIYQILLDGVEAGYVQASHYNMAVTNAQSIIEEWSKQYGPHPPERKLEAKEMYLWDAMFYTTTCLPNGMKSMAIGVAVAVLGYSAQDVRKRAPESYEVYEVSKTKMTCKN